jgi:hypothetical protein
VAGALPSSSTRRTQAKEDKQIAPHTDFNFIYKKILRYSHPKGNVSFPPPVILK